jgi:hypothetical protein
MPLRLYLDTARLGRMSRRAQGATVDFVRLAGEEGCTLYWDRFLRDGFGVWPRRLQTCYSGLSDWRGIGHLKSSLAELAGVSGPDCVLLANRSAELVRLAARVMSRQCERVLVTDLTWPNYARIIERQCRHARRQEAVVPLRDAILRDRAPLGEIVQRILKAYRANQCDGLFLPAVSHDGIRLPIRMVCRAVSQYRPPRFVVVDGVQAFCHAPVDLAGDWCDMFIAGCHKWFGGHIPLGLAVLPRRESAALIKRVLDRHLRTGHWHDPLVHFIWQSEHESRDRFSETVNLTGLFSCQASLTEWLQLPFTIQRRFKQQLANARQLASVAMSCGWQPLQPSACFRSGIVLITTHTDNGNQHADVLRAGFLRLGIAVTTYPDGATRLSMPTQRWNVGSLRRLGTVLRCCAGRRPSPHTLTRTTQSPVIPPTLAL